MKVKGLRRFEHRRRRGRESPLEAEDREPWIGERIVTVKHVHRWRWNSSIGRFVVFRCATCDERCHRRMTPEEFGVRGMSALVKMMKKARRTIPGARYQSDIHAIWHDFQDRFFTKDGKPVLLGYKLMGSVERWAERYPYDVRLVGVDDSHFMGSTLVLIEHRTKSQYMGTSCVYLPQCGEPPAEFFLYPGDRGALQEALVNVAKEERPIRERERQRERRERRFLKSRVPGPNAKPGEPAFRPMRQSKAYAVSTRRKMILMRVQQRTE